MTYRKDNVCDIHIPHYYNPCHTLYPTLTTYHVNQLRWIWVVVSNERNWDVISKPKVSDILYITYAAVWYHIYLAHQPKLDIHQQAKCSVH